MPKPQKQITPQTIEQITQFLKDNGAPPVTLRSKLPLFTCGFVHNRTVTNHDSLGIGPKERVIFGNQRQAVGYPLESLAEYMAERGFVIESRQDDAKKPTADRPGL